jgi:hypothetical protein
VVIVAPWPQTRCRGVPGSLEGAKNPAAEAWNRTAEKNAITLSCPPCRLIIVCLRPEEEVGDRSRLEHMSNCPAERVLGAFSPFTSLAQSDRYETSTLVERKEESARETSLNCVLASTPAGGNRRGRNDRQGVIVSNTSA